MRIALLGGTGDIGEGLALRLARDTDHEIVIGSREAEKAATAADEYAAQVTDERGASRIQGRENATAAAGADVVVCSVPAYFLVETIESVEADLDGSILVSPAVGMQRDEAGVHYNPPGVGSVTELAASAAPEDVPVVGAFHNLAAGKLARLEESLDWDVPVVGDDAAAKSQVIDLASEIRGLRGLDAGGVENAAEVESLTPLLINLASHNDDLHDLGVTFQ